MSFAADLLTVLPRADGRAMDPITAPGRLQKPSGIGIFGILKKLLVEDRQNRYNELVCNALLRIDSGRWGIRGQKIHPSPWRALTRRHARFLAVGPTAIRPTGEDPIVA